MNQGDSHGNPDFKGTEENYPDVTSAEGEMVRLDGLDHQAPLDYNMQLEKTIVVTTSQFIPFCYCEDVLVPLSLVEWLWK